MDKEVMEARPRRGRSTWLPVALPAALVCGLGGAAAVVVGPEPTTLVPVLLPVIGLWLAGRSRER